MQRRVGPLAESAPGVGCGWMAGTIRRGAPRWRALARMPVRETHLICGMLNTKDVRGYMAPLAAQVTQLHAVSIPAKRTPCPPRRRGMRRPRSGMQAVVAESVAQALADIAAKAPQARVLICGSLYLAGGILRENG